MRNLGTIGRAAFGAGVALALGLGATQAVAEPQRPAAEGYTCDGIECWNDCVSRGYRYGVCVDEFTCECWHW